MSRKLAAAGLFPAIVVLDRLGLAHKLVGTFRLARARATGRGRLSR
jgi:hypothetical protein